MIPSSDQIASDSSPSWSRIRALSASAQAAWTRPPNGRQDAQPPVADLVAEALDDDRPVRRHHARGLLLLAQELDQVARPRAGRGRSRARAPPAGCSTAQRANAPIASPSSLGRPTPSPFQNGTAPGSPGAGVTITRSRPISSIRQVDGAEQERLAGPRLVDHLLVELADPPAVRAASPRTGRGRGSCRRWSPRAAARPAARRIVPAIRSHTIRGRSSENSELTGSARRACRARSRAGCG